MRKSENRNSILRNLTMVNNNFSPNYDALLQDNIEYLSSLIKNQKFIFNYNENINKEEQKQKVIELNDLHFETIQYILSKKKRTSDELLIIKEFLGSLKFFNTSLMNINKDKLLLSLSSCLKVEKKQKNTIIFRYGNKGNKLYIVIKGELSILIVKEIKIELNSLYYFMHLLLLKVLKEEELLKKTIMANNKIGLKIDEKNFEYNYEKLNNYFNYHLKNKIKKIYSANYRHERKSMKRNILKTHSSNIYKTFDLERRNTSFVILNNIDKDNSNLEINKNYDDIYYSELEIFNFELYELNKIINYFIELKEQSLYKKNYFDSINDYIQKTSIPSNITKKLSNMNKYQKKETYLIYQYFEIGKKKTGDIFGELALQHIDNKRTATIISKTDCILGYFLRDDYKSSLHDIEIKKRKKEVNFIMSFPIFDKMNWVIFESRFFNYFMRETLYKGNYILKQGHKCNKIYFIMNGLFELTTSLNYDIIKKFINSKLNKYQKFLNEFNFIDKQENIQNKSYIFKLSIIDNKDIIGLDDYFILNDISFVNVQCISNNAIVFSIEKNLLFNLNKRINHLKNNLKLMNEKRVEIMIKKLLDIMKIILNKPTNKYKKFNSSENDKKRRIKSALLNNNTLNHKKIKNVLFFSQRNNLNNQDENINVLEEINSPKSEISNIYKKSKDISFDKTNEKENYIKENILTQDINRNRNKNDKWNLNEYIQNIQKKFKHIKNQRIYLMNNDIFNSLDKKNEKVPINNKTNNKNIIFNKNKNVNSFNHKIKINEIINKNKNNKYVKNKKINEEINLSDQINNSNYIDFKKFYNSYRSPIKMRSKIFNSFKNLHNFSSSSFNSLNNRNSKTLSNNYKKENEIDINSYFYKIKKLDKNQKVLSPQKYLKILLGTRFKKHEENIGNKIISKKLLENEKNIEYSRKIKSCNSTSIPLTRYKNNRKLIKKIVLSVKKNKEKIDNNIKKVKSRESPIVDFLFYNTMISQYTKNKEEL